MSTFSDPQAVARYAEAPLRQVPVSSPCSR